jgi:lysophospholipase L1-like esterase
VGSSSFNFWKDLQQDFPDHRVINRGFGGSGLPNVIEYADLVVLPYKPKQVVVYCGENDFYQAKDVTPELVASRFEQLFKMIRKELPKTYVTFVSLKPSPRRKELMPEMVKTNALVKEFIEKEKRATFVNVYDPMLDAAGRPRKELFKSDSLHMNEIGYDLWQKAIRPHLRKTRKPG